MTDGVTLNFVDPSTSDEATIVMRRVDTGVALSVSMKSNGDIEIVMPNAVAQELARALARAVG